MVLVQAVEVTSILLAALTFGVFWGPWIALTRSIRRLGPDTFLEIVHLLDRNLGGLMSVLMPVTILSLVPALFLTHGPRLFLSVAALVLFVVTLIVTAAIEVPVVKIVRGWTSTPLPANWEALRDRWLSFHLARVIPGFLGVAALVIAVAL
jgi:hypothetical protein